MLVLIALIPPVMRLRDTGVYGSFYHSSMALCCHAICIPKREYHFQKLPDITMCQATPFTESDSFTKIYFVAYYIE